MPAVSKAQQRFMGMVHAADKGETPASPEVAKVSADMKDTDAKDFASTKHDGLPDHVKEQLKSVVREVIREKNGMNEMSSNDVHFKHIMKMYDRGGSFTKKKIGAVVCKDPKASRKDIEEVLFDSDYRDIIEFEDELGLKEIREKYSSVNEEFKHVIHVDTPTQVVSKPVAAQIMALAKKGVRASEIGLEMGFVGNAKLAADTFQKVKNKIYFELDKRNESVNEALDPKAEKFLDAIQVNDRSIKDLKNITVDATPQGNWSVYYKGKRMFTLNGKMLDDKTIMKYGLEHMDESLSEGKKIQRPVKFKSVNEEHDCGCNENHDCGCGGLHEHHINEDINADANGIAGLTASRATAVKDFLENNNINSNKLYLFLKKGNLKDRMDFVTALVGKPGNPIQKKVIKQFSN
jgi:hypothetical protein